MIELRPIVLIRRMGNGLSKYVIRVTERDAKQVVVLGKSQQHYVS